MNIREYFSIFPCAMINHLKLFTGDRILFETMTAINPFPEARI